MGQLQGKVTVFWSSRLQFLIDCSLFLEINQSLFNYYFNQFHYYSWFVSIIMIQSLHISFQWIACFSSPPPKILFRELECHTCYYIISLDCLCFEMNHPCSKLYKLLFLSNLILFLFYIILYSSVVVVI